MYRFSPKLVQLMEANNEDPTLVKVKVHVTKYQLVIYVQVDFNETGLVVTEPYFNFTSITEAMTEIFFEEYQFKSIFKCNRKLPQSL